jgi:monoamine oxidase
VPGTARLRPGPETGFERLYLAGAWTDTGWPATMEGAVRSGNRAARHALRAVGVARFPVDIDQEVVA